MTRTPGATKARLHRYQQNLPSSLQNSPPLVTWRHDACNSRILRLYLLPAGWLLVSDDVRVPLAEWIERAGVDYTVDDFREGRVAAFNKREVKGHERLLPHDVDEWPAGVFEIGCRKHGLGTYQLSDLATDAREARETRRRVERAKSPSPV
ncbi:hypothetical protein [Microbacterium kunmingense]|uniref:hypothetical protein n=1 Tax=Microbacterium kunmingense TaxID=2915939 RepID=UPI0020054DCD|nr:hypothetical protein [Microbacterium kunmingense]